MIIDTGFDNRSYTMQTVNNLDWDTSATKQSIDKAADKIAGALDKTTGKLSTDIKQGTDKLTAAVKDGASGTRRNPHKIFTHPRGREAGHAVCKFSF